MSTPVVAETDPPVTAWPAAPLLVRGVSWPDRVPHLTGVAGGAVVAVPLRGRVAFRVAAGKVCSGHTRLDGPRKGHVPCPSAQELERGSQCSSCSRRDDFRFAHHAHRGGHVPDGLVQYLNQPHWVYVASFADGTHKVGTAVDFRKVERLDEQGAVVATHVARTPDGLMARVFEDAVTARLGLTQFKRATTKARALAAPFDLPQLRRDHERVAAQAAAMLGQEAARDGVSVGAWPWAPPSAMDLALVGASRRMYEPVLTGGEHGFYVRAVCGSSVLASLGAGDGDLVVVDLSALRGRRVTFGDFQSPRQAVQHELF